MAGSDDELGWQLIQLRETVFVYDDCMSLLGVSFQLDDLFKAVHGESVKKMWNIEGYEIE